MKYRFLTLTTCAVVDNWCSYFCVSLKREPSNSILLEVKLTPSRSSPKSVGTAEESVQMITAGLTIVFGVL